MELQTNSMGFISKKYNQCLCTQPEFEKAEFGRKFDDRNTNTLLLKRYEIRVNLQKINLKFWKLVSSYIFVIAD